MVEDVCLYSLRRILLWNCSDLLSNSPSAIFLQIGEFLSFGGREKISARELLAHEYAYRRIFNSLI